MHAARRSVSLVVLVLHTPWRESVSIREIDGHLCVITVCGGEAVKFGRCSASALVPNPPDQNATLAAPRRTGDSHIVTPQGPWVLTSVERNVASAAMRL